MMRDSEQSSLQVENRNSATMTLKALSSVTVTELKSTSENVDDEEMAEENFHLHLSEDEDDEKTEKQNGESDEMIENEVLNKFDTAEDVCMESIDAKTEDELLNDEQIAKSGASVSVSTNEEEKPTESIQEGEKEKIGAEKDVPVEEEKLTPEAEVVTEKKDEQEKIIEEAKETTEEENVTSQEEMDTREDEDIRKEEDKITIKEEAIEPLEEEKVQAEVEQGGEIIKEIKKEKSDAVDSETNKKDDSIVADDSSVNSSEVSEKKKKQEGGEGEETEQTNAEILKNQIMDTEDLLQIVDNDTEENDKESNDKIESEDNEAETDKNEEEDEPEQDEDSQGEKKTSDDGVDIEESSLSKDATDVDMDREYQSIVDDAITKENEEKDKKSESESEVAEETPSETPVDESMDESVNGSMDIDEDENKENNEEAVNIAATPEKEEETSEPPKKDDSDSTKNITSAKRTLSEENLHQEAKKIKLTTESDVTKELPAENEPPVDSEEEKKRLETSKQLVLGTVGTYLKKNCLKNLCYEDLEEICMQKVCEAICYKSEIGELRHQLGVQEQMAEMWRKEVAQLSKQARDLEIVNKRLLHEVRLKNEREKPLVPVKITRSVGLQVRSDMLPNVVASKQRRLNRSPATGSPAFNQKPPVRSPLVNNSNNRINKLPVQNRPQQNMARVSPVQNAKVKVANQKSCLLSQALQNATNAAANATGSSTTTSTPSQAVATPTTVSVPVSTSTATPSKTTIPVNRIAVKKPALTTKQVIDLTDEDIVTTPPRSTPGATKNTMVSKAVTTTAGVRILTSGIKPGVLTTGVPTTNASRFMYLYNNNQLLTADGKPTSQKVMFKIGAGNGVLASVANGSAIAVNTSARTAQQVAQLKLASQGTASVTTTNAITRAPASKVHVSKHPAPLPAPPITQNSQPARKPIPPKPHLSIKRSGGGIVLSWRMPYNLDNFESIVSYQLYAYQETTSPPSSDMWRKVGDVKALALPMACTLTQFADGNKYHFAVRAVDVHKRMGPFSAPEQILL